MRVAELFDTHVGEDIYVVGTGPSMRYFPASFFEGRVTIGLNQAWKYAPLTYSVTVHPELVVEYSRLGGRHVHPTTWVIKAHKAPLNLSENDKRWYVFKSAGHRGHEERFMRTRHNFLYVGRGIQTAGICLAANMGARSVILVGCDMGVLNGAHHGHDQHVRYCGLDPDDVYAEMRRSTDHLRRIVRDELGIPILTLHPFIGLTAASIEEDVARLDAQLGYEPLPAPEEKDHKARIKTDKFAYRAPDGGLDPEVRAKQKYGGFADGRPLGHNVQ